MRKLTCILIFGALVFIGVVGTGVAQSVLAKAGLSPDKEIRVCELENSAFGAQERIVYKLYYNLNFIWIAAGEVEFKVQDLGSQYKLTALGTTYGSYEWFFKVRDYYESYVDKETLLPILTIRDIEEGNYTLYERVEYDQETGLGVGYRGKSKEEAMERPGEFSMEHCLHDILSAIYFMRNLNLANATPNSTYPVTVFMDRKEYPLDVRYLGKMKEKKIRGLGKFEVYELAPEVVAGDVFSENSEMRVWASTNSSCLPLQIESPISVGSIKAVLMEHSGLIHNLGN